MRVLKYASIFTAVSVLLSFSSFNVQAASDDEAIEEIVVTGSYIKRRNQPQPSGSSCSGGSSSRRRRSRRRHRHRCRRILRRIPRARIRGPTASSWTCVGSIASTRQHPQPPPHQHPLRQAHPRMSKIVQPRKGRWQKRVFPVTQCRELAAMDAR